MSFFRSLGKAPFDLLNGMVDGAGELVNNILGDDDDGDKPKRGESGQEKKPKRKEKR